MIESIVFAGAFITYLGLTACALLALRGPVPRMLTILVGLIAAAHVVGVWSHRYGWDVTVATRNGYAGFVIFRPLKQAPRFFRPLPGLNGICEALFPRLAVRLVSRLHHGPQSVSPTGPFCDTTLEMWVMGRARGRAQQVR